MNYEMLLQKYINHVKSCEGSTFIPINKEDCVRHIDHNFSEEEIQELNRLSCEKERYLFFKDGQYFGIVSQKYWEENHCLDDQLRLETLRKSGFDLIGFCDPMESYIEHLRSFEEGRERLISLGFIEMSNPWE